MSCKLCGRERCHNEEHERQWAVVTMERVQRELERLRASDAQFNEGSMHVIDCIERVLDGAETGDVYDIRRAALAPRPPTG